MNISPLAGKIAPKSVLINPTQLIDAYYQESPDPGIPAEKVAFGTSGHRGNSLKRGFNQAHILAITQSISDWRKMHHIEGPLFMGVDTHALSLPALKTALEVLSANQVDVILATDDEYTPTPAISHAILCHNRGRKKGLADGIVITPSHNPPDMGGIKYNSPNGGPADTNITSLIEQKANEYLVKKLQGIKRIPFEKAIVAPTTHRHNYLQSYVADLASVIDFEVIGSSKIHLGVDPLGGSGIHYWEEIKNKYNIDITVVNHKIDPTFSFMTLDWDGQIRMDPSSPYAMQPLIHLKDRFPLACGCDPDHDRHGIVTKKGLLPPNHYLCVMIAYLFANRPHWNKTLAIGKTIVSSQMIDRVAKKLGRKVHEVPVGFKWFVDGLFDGSLGFVGEESAGASFLRKDGRVWTTDKDGIIASLLAQEITAKIGKDPQEVYLELIKELGNPVSDRIEAAATFEQKNKLKKLSKNQIKFQEFAGEKIESIQTHAPGNGEPLGGIKISTENGWFAARPSGTEDLYKIYGESFLGKEHLERIFQEAQDLVNQVISS